MSFHLYKCWTDEYKYDGTKLIFYFTADGRIDFRELVKDLAATFKTRIELRQIGLRDEVRRIGGNGICGRELCCCSYLGDFDMVSIKMAKEQGLSLTPSKISGCCGRLMCCLKYEQEVYEEKNAKLPGIGAIVNTPDGEGTVEGLEILKEVVKVKIVGNEDNVMHKKYQMKEINPHLWRLLLLEPGKVGNSNLVQVFLPYKMYMRIRFGFVVQHTLVKDRCSCR